MSKISYVLLFLCQKKIVLLFLCQKMQSIDLFGTVNTVVCTLDSINYLTKADEVKKCFSLVHNYLDPDGLFLFDVNSPYKFENIYGSNAYVLEDESDEGGAIFCGWQNEYDEESGLCDFYLTLFEENEDGSYFREDEHQTERCYKREELVSALEGAGFELIGIFSDFGFSEINDTDERWYIAARAKK